MMDRIGNLFQIRGKYSREATGIKNSRTVFAGILFTILLMGNMASAADVTYYLNATAGVNIGADGTTSVTGSNQIIPPVITALLDKTGNNSRGALTNDHPHELYNHSRWYFTSDYSINTKINANPAGKVFIYASAGPYPNLSVRLYDYYPSNGSKTLIGSSPNIILSGGATNTPYSYNISSPVYTVPLNHRLMLQFDFDPKTHGNTNARVYASKLNSYLTVEEIPITYNVTINSTPSSANVSAGANFTYNLTVNNTGTTDGNYSVNVSDSDTLNFQISVPGMTTLFVPAGSSNQTTLTVTAYEGAPKDAVDTTNITITSIENSLFSNITQITTTVSVPSSLDCAQCHETYIDSVNRSNHNQTKNAAAPTCISCHSGYESQHRGFIVNETNTCRNCHIQNESGFYERHSGSSDCTSCHFANTTQPFDKNASLFTHDHNLTVEHNFYEYNQSGMPVRTNSGFGVGMFPYYTCTLTCHKYNATTGVEGKVDEAANSWLNSSHARSLHMSGDNRMSCARCKSPANFNASANNSSMISQPDWQGIQCRICHNLHDRKFPNNTGPGGLPIAFYNSTLSSLAGYPVYEPVANATVLCQNCHTGTSHDSKFAGTHKDTVNFTCINCHMNSSFNNELHTFEVKNTTSGVTGCEVCHQPEDHTWAQTSIHYDKVECVSCHDQTITRNATGFAVSLDNNYGIYNDTISSKWTTYKISHGSAATWPLHNISKSINCNKCHGTVSVFNGTIAPALPDSEICAGCHLEYSNSVLSTNHNKTNNVNAPECTGCHPGYEPVSGHTSGNKGYTANESNTCRNCHIQNESGFYERHSGSSDCTSCHFANTTRPFDRNASLFTHDHNLTVEHNFYEYNQSGMPVRTNSGFGVGMFPYYTCTLTCHKYNATTGVEGKIDEAANSWLNSSHARSLNMSGDNKMSCARCKSPANFNASANNSSLISQPDWQGIQCRVCHNLHDRRFPNNTGPGGLPIAFYNSTASSLAGYPVYEQVPDATELCQKCHTGSSHDSMFAGTHKDTVNFTCKECHMNSSFNNELHKFEVRNTSSGITGCEVCHRQEDHTWPETGKHIDKADCVACHDQTVSKNDTGYAVSADNSYGIYKDPVTNNWTTYKVSRGLAASWPLHNVSKDVKCEKCHGATSVYSGIIVQELSCQACHTTYGNAVNLSRHNQTLNPGAPNCTMCHTGYQPVTGHTSGNRGYTVNESNTCRNCHIQNESGFYERHTGSSDCTACHFANTTRQFSENTSLFTHDHNLTIEHNFYEYNRSGMPVRTNSGFGVGMFPYYTCTLTCHKNNATTGMEGKIDEAANSWFNSSHARSLHMSGDNKMSCARCKSPANFNASANNSSLISRPDWQGIQCRVCHNLHDRKFPNNTGPGSLPIAYYNSTASSLAGYPAYEQVADATELCQKCHTGSSHDSKFAGTHKNTVNFTCANCHMNSSFNNELHKLEVRNTTSGLTGCEVCHKASEHSVLLCKGKIDCVGCHDQTVRRNITGYAVSPDNNYGIYKDNTTGNWTTYKVSKGSAVSWPLHNITLNVTCEKCHGSISVYSGLITQATGDFCERCHYQPPNGTGSPNTDGSHVLHKSIGYSEPETSCDYCHATEGRNESGHPGTWDNANVVTNDSASIGIYVKNNSTGSDDTCADVSCHTLNLSHGARVGYSTWNANSIGLCNQCHSTETSGVPPVGDHIKHSTQNVSCSTCHGNNSDSGEQTGHRNGRIEINLTNLASNGSYVSGTCTVYCHDPNPSDLNFSIPTWNTTKIVCGDCHTLPPTIFTTRHGNSHPEDPQCDDCHGAAAGTGTHIKHRDGAVETFELRQCLSCHEINGSALTKVDSASFGMHRTVNNTDGGITNSDCLVCHFNITGMFADYKPLPGINVYVCKDCHRNQTVNSTKVGEHIPGANLSVTTMNCEDCHVNSLNIPDNASTINSSIGKALHYGTMTSMIKPTAGIYNEACDICHNNSINKTKYGAQDKQIYTPHTATGKCNMCHIPTGEADTLHNSSLSMPVVSCKDCHTINASKYKAPDITGTPMEGYSQCSVTSTCHDYNITDRLDTLTRHNLDLTVNGTGGSTDIVYLNDEVRLTVSKGSIVIITSRVNDSGLNGGASRIGGAEYYIGNDPGKGKGIPMDALDGSYDAVFDNWENVIATLNTSSLSNGEHKIFVRGVDIGKQWSDPKNAMLIVESQGYINVSSNVPGSIVYIDGHSNTTDSNGNYSWGINFGTYSVIVSKDPEYYANTSIGIIVTANNITNHNVVLALKPNGTISGTVMNV